MNIFDVIVAVVMGACMLGAYRKGLIRSLFGLVSSLGSLLLANALYPAVSRFLRGTPVYTAIKQWVIDSMALEDFVHAQTVKAQTELINSLSLPDFVLRSMLANNNPEIYKLLKVSTVADYIGGYFANVLTNILSFVIVLVLTRIVFAGVYQMLGIIAGLPVLKSFDKIGGLAAGAVQGCIVVWILFVLLTFLCISPERAGWYENVKESRVAVYFYENNILMDTILKVFP